MYDFVRLQQERGGQEARVPSPTQKVSHHLELEHPPSTTVKENSLLLTLPSLWYFDTVAQVRRCRGQDKNQSTSISKAHITENVKLLGKTLQSTP